MSFLLCYDDFIFKKKFLCNDHETQSFKPHLFIVYK